MTDIAELYGLTSAAGWSAPSTVDYDLYAEGDACAYCLATHKPGVCAGTKRGQGGQATPGQAYQQPHVAVPIAPGKKTAQQAAIEQLQQEGYQTAYLKAQQLAQQLGAQHGHQAVQAATHDYARALHQHGRAVARADQLRATLQGRHDSAEARNKAIDQANAARQVAAITKANAAAKQAALRKAAAKHPHAHGHHSTWMDEVSLYALGDPDRFEVYALVAAAHWGCEVGEFCRNPLHPGPCKGWKHMLHSVAPGAYHAYEKQRVTKLNEKRKAKIAELEAAGKKVPAYLKKEITYQQVPVKPEGVNFEAPTPKEAISKLPATAKEIGAKIAMKHEAIAKAKANKQAAALVNVVVAHSPLSNAQHKVMEKKVANAIASLKPGEKPSDVPLVANTLKIAADKLAAGAKLNDTQHAELLDAMKEHVDQGIPELPLLHVSAKNQAEKLKKDAADAAIAAQKAKDLEAANKLAAEKAVTKEKLKQLLTAHEHIDWAKVPQSDRDAAIASLKQSVSSGHLDVAEKLKANAMIAKISASTPPKETIPGVTGELKKTGQHLGTHGAQVAVDEAGKKFLIKPHAPYGDFTSHGEVGASQLAKAAGLPTAEVHLTKEGTVQEMVPGAKDAFPGKHFDPSKLSDKDILDIQKHHVVDWLIGNHDAHPGNFLRDKNGDLIEIDKGQAFKHYHEDSLSSTYHPNQAYGEVEPVYNTLLKAAKKGDVELHPVDSGPLADFIKKVQDLPDDQLRAMFRPYAEAASKAGKLPGAPKGGKAADGTANPGAVGQFLDKIVDRKKKLGTAFAALYLKHQKPSQMVKTPGVSSSELSAKEISAAQAKEILATPGMSLTTKAGHLSKAHFDALPKEDQDKLVKQLKDIEGDAGHEVSLKATALIEKFTGEKPKGITPAAPLAADAPAHVKTVQSLATGATYGTAKAKVAAYEKLTPEEYHSLPLHVQDKIHVDLETAHAKFLDPKKKMQVKAILDKLGFPKETPEGAGAPHHGPPAEQPVAAEKYVNAWESLKKLATGGGLSANKVATVKNLSGYDAAELAKHKQQVVDGLSTAWMIKHTTDLPLSAHEKDVIKQTVEAEAAHMLENGEVNPPFNGVMDVAKDADEAAANPEAKLNLIKKAAGLKTAEHVNPSQAGAGGTATVGATPGLTGKNHHDAYKIAAVLAGGTGTSSQSTAEKFDQAKKNGTLTQQVQGSANAVATGFMNKKAPAELSAGDAEKLKKKVTAEVEQMILTGSLKPPVGGVLEATKKGAPTAELMKAAGISYKPPTPGKVSPGAVAHGVAHPKGGKIVEDPHNGGKTKQVVATGQAVKINAWNKKVAAATKGSAGHDAAPLSISKIEAMYSTAKGGKNGAKLGDVLASKSKSALHAYSGSQYIDINGYLRRKAKGEHVGESYVKANEPLITAMDAAFKHSPAKQDLVVYRGIHDAASTFGSVWSPDKSMVGTEFSEPGYSSTSTSAGIGFGGGMSGAKFRILVPKGTPAISMHGGQHSGEDEILLPRGTKFRIVADNGYQNGTRMFDVEVIPA